MSDRVFTVTEEVRFDGDTLYAVTDNVETAVIIGESHLSPSDLNKVGTWRVIDEDCMVLALPYDRFLTVTAHEVLS